MSDNITATFAAPAASNYSDKVGKVVNLTAVATGEARCTLLTGTDDGTESNLPLGIITASDNQNGGSTTVCVGGLCYGYAGGAITPGTNALVMTGASSLLYLATEGNFVVGRYMGKFVAVAGDLIPVYVEPKNYETT